MEQASKGKQKNASLAPETMGIPPKSAKHPHPPVGRPPQILRKTPENTRSRLAAMTKLPVLPGVGLTLTRLRLGETLFQPTTDFNLSDPNCHIIRPSYSSLHDPNLNDYYHKKDMHDKLKKQNFITEDDKVVCSLKEYNTFKQYLDTVKTDLDKSFRIQMKEHMMNLVKLQGEGQIAENVTLADMREFLLEEGAKKLKQLQSTSDSSDRDRGQKDGLQTASCVTQTEDVLCKQLYEERSRLKLIEKDVQQEVNKARYLKEVKDQQDSKKKSMYELKQAIQQRKMQEMVNNIHDYKIMTEASSSGKRLLEQLYKTPQLGMTPMDEHCLLQRRRTLERLAPLPSNARVKVEKANKTEQSKIIQGKKIRQSERKSSKGPVVRLPSYPILAKTLKSGALTKATCQTQLKSVVRHAVLDHLGTKGVRRRLAESIKCEVKLKTSARGSKPAAQRACSARIASDMLKCVSRVVNPFKPSDEPVCRILGGNKDKKPSGQSDDPSSMDEEKLNSYVTTLIAGILEEVKQQVIVKVQQVCPKAFQVATAKASKTALDVVTNMLEDVKDHVMQGNIGLNTFLDVEAVNPEPFDSQPPTMSALEVAHAEMEEAGLQSELDDGHPGTWMSSKNMDYIATGLMESVFNNILDQDLVLLQEPGTLVSHEVSVPPTDGEMSNSVVIQGSLKPPSPVNCVTSLKDKYVSLNDLTKSAGNDHFACSRGLFSALPNFPLKGKVTEQTSYSKGSVSMEEQLRSISPSPNVTEAESQRISDTDEEDGKSTSPVPLQLSSTMSVLDVNRLLTPGRQEKLGLPWRPTHHLIDNPGVPPKKVKIHTVYRNPLFFPTEAVQSTSTSSSDGESSTPEKALSQAGSDEEGVDENMLAWMTSLRDTLNAFPPIAPTPPTSHPPSHRGLSTRRRTVSRTSPQRKSEN